MNKYSKVEKIVKDIYTNSKGDFAQWMWKNHVPVVASNAKKLAQDFSGNSDLAVAGALLHDFGDAFVHRHSSNHAFISKNEAKKVLISADYSQDQISEIIDVIIENHSCRDGRLPKTLEGKIVATSDALAHLETDFYVQLAWRNLPEDKSYEQYLHWVNEKLDRDYKIKIFFEDVRVSVKDRYNALKEVFKISSQT